MTEPSRPEVVLHCDRLSRVIRNDMFGLHGTEVDEIRELYCPVDDPRGITVLRLGVPGADAERWRRASAQLLGIVRRAGEEWIEAGWRLTPPPTTGRRLLWQLRHLGRRAAAEAELRATRDRIRAEVRAAYRAFRDRVADLTDVIAADQARRREESERRYREEEAARRRALAELADAPVWGYRIDRYEILPDSYLLQPRDQLTIILETVAPATARPTPEPPRVRAGGLTAAQVNAEIERRRADEPYLFVTWELRSRERLCALTRASLPYQAWERFTGVAVRERQHTAAEQERLRSRHRTSTYGPSITDFGGTSF